jgi:hypothetical protein
MRVRRVFLVAIAGVFALLLNVYVVVSALMNRSDAGTKLTADECADPDIQTQTNPNKMLFMSCGGFLE